MVEVMNSKVCCLQLTIMSNFYATKKKFLRRKQQAQDDL